MEERRCSKSSRGITTKMQSQRQTPEVPSEISVEASKALVKIRLPSASAANDHLIQPKTYSLGRCNSKKYDKPSL
jgi:hypothetical protein